MIHTVRPQDRCADAAAGGLYATHDGGTPERI